MSSTHSMSNEEEADRTIQKVDKIPGPVICLEILALSLCTGIVFIWEKVIEKNTLQIIHIC